MRPIINSMIPRLSIVAKRGQHPPVAPISSVSSAARTAVLHTACRGCESLTDDHFGTDRARPPFEGRTIHPAAHPDVRMAVRWAFTFYSGVADKQCSELLTRTMKERYLPPEPFLPWGLA